MVGIYSLIVLLVGCDRQREKDEATVIQNEVSIEEHHTESSAEVENKLEKMNNEAPQEIQSISELWNNYKKAKQNVSAAIQQGNLDTIKHWLLIAGEISMELSRPDIAAWQFNNIAHYSIQEFKTLTDYESKLQSLATLPEDSSKPDSIKKIVSLFKDHFKLLLDCETDLKRAQEIDKHLEASNRTVVIERNIGFINWVRKLIYGKS